MRSPLPAANMMAALEMMRPFKIGYDNKTRDYNVNSDQNISSKLSRFHHARHAHGYRDVP